MRGARAIVVGILTLVVLAAIDGNYTHWSCQVTKPNCGKPAEAPPAPAAAPTTTTTTRRSEA